MAIGGWERKPHLGCLWLTKDLDPAYSSHWMCSLGDNGWLWIRPALIVRCGSPQLIPSRCVLARRQANAFRRSIRPQDAPRVSGLRIQYFLMFPCPFRTCCYAGTHRTLSHRLGYAQTNGADVFLIFQAHIPACSQPYGLASLLALLHHLIISTLRSRQLTLDAGIIMVLIR